MEDTINIKVHPYLTFCSITQQYEYPFSDTSEISVVFCLSELYSRFVHVVIDLRFVVAAHGAGRVEQGGKQVLLDVSHFGCVLV